MLLLQLCHLTTNTKTITTEVVPDFHIHLSTGQGKQCSTCQEGDFKGPTESLTSGPAEPLQKEIRSAGREPCFAGQDGRNLLMCSKCPVTEYAHEDIFQHSRALIVFICGKAIFCRHSQFSHENTNTHLATQCSFKAGGGGGAGVSGKSLHFFLIAKPTVMAV